MTATPPPLDLDQARQEYIGSVGYDQLGPWAKQYGQSLMDELAAAREALLRLANATDDVGVEFFDGDDMPVEVEEMQCATLAARDLLPANQPAPAPPTKTNND